MVKRGIVLLLIIFSLTFLLISSVSAVEYNPTSDPNSRYYIPPVGEGACVNCDNVETPKLEGGLGGSGKYNPTPVEPTGAKAKIEDLAFGEFEGTLGKKETSGQKVISGSDPEGDLFCPLDMSLSSNGRDCEGDGTLKGGGLVYVGTIPAVFGPHESGDFVALKKVGSSGGIIAKAKELIKRLKLKTLDSLGGGESKSASSISVSPTPSRIPIKESSTGSEESTIGGTRGSESSVEETCKGRIVRDFATGKAKCDESNLISQPTRIFRPLVGVRSIFTSGSNLISSVYFRFTRPTTYSYSEPDVGPRETGVTTAEPIDTSGLVPLESGGGISGGGLGYNAGGSGLIG